MTKSFFTFLILLSLFSACNTDEPDPMARDYKQDMRAFVMGISSYAKGIQPGFAVIPQNGIELVSDNGEEDGQPHSAYLAAIDGNGQEDLFYGYNSDNRATPTETNTYLRTFLDLSQAAGNTILVTDYCSSADKMDDSYAKNSSLAYIPFAADQRELDQIPAYPQPIFAENNKEITSLSEAQNFLYLINPENFATKSDFIQAVTATNYDLLIMDLFFHDDSPFTAAEVNQLKAKANGGSRLLIAYMSIGEAEDYRYYWDADWDSNQPAWLDKENPNWKGNFKVKYWDADWQAIIYGNDNSYLKRILDAGFDGVYLDIIDAFEFYE